MGPMSGHQGTYGEPITHYSVLSTVEQIYELTNTGLAATTPPITDTWTDHPVKMSWAGVGLRR